jgi:hypothetical protein
LIQWIKSPTQVAQSALDTAACIGGLICANPLVLLVFWQEVW